MALRKYAPSGDASSLNMSSINFTKKLHEKVQVEEAEAAINQPMESDVDIDLREVYFLIMHFLSTGPCHRTYGQFWNELLEHQLLPRRYHAWYSRSGNPSGDENDNGISFPLSYNKLVQRYPHIEKDHLVKLLKQLILSSAAPLNGIVGGNPSNAADVPTLLGSGSYSLLESERNKSDKMTIHPPGFMRWPHIQADQVRGLSLREIGGGFTKHHRAPSIRAACYTIAKPSTMVQKMEIIKKLRGHRNAVYCAIFDRTGQLVITGSDDRLVKIWSMETAFCLASCRGHEGDITDLAVSSNNVLVASASNDFIIRVWRLPDGQPISVLRGHTGAVTAIAFSPRPSSIYQLLSSSDDGTCRIWDARSSQFTPRIYVPKPLDYETGRTGDPSSSSSQQIQQILCCAFNANGMVFVTGSSDTYARVWNACKSNPEDSDQPNHEMDVLSGHENDVNYVQFSGCAVTCRSFANDSPKEDNIPKFKNSWFSHDNIVTCSRDGSAIIWIPRSRRSHGKVGRWTRAYHLKVPPPPMPPQPPRGGPRQRFLPTPRGVNMIIWSLDNRFVLAAIMDCRICVWNAVDGSLVHSLTGHSESTYVLDVHPFNPRIAMSAGYDGKTIIWDIWEGVPVRVYETGRFKLVDGKFSPDGTSIILSDEVGQIYILASGQGESQKDAKYDQFFLGDYRPLIQDTHGNVLDQETQLTPYVRNIQDLLCDSTMIPYPEPYQNMYQQRRLGALGIEWHPSSVKFAVGPGDVNSQDHQFLPFVDVERWFDPIPEFVDVIDWEPENEILSDDNDSEYNVTDEYSSEAERGTLSASSSGEPECSVEDDDHHHGESLRRSRRKKHKVEIEFTTSSGRRVKRRNLDECDGTTSRTIRKRKSRNKYGPSRKKVSTSKSSRPQRLAARNALNLFSQITRESTDGEDLYESETDTSASGSLTPDSNIPSNDSDLSTQNPPPEISEPLSNTGTKRRLVLKFAIRDPKKLANSENTRFNHHEDVDVMGSSDRNPMELININRTGSSHDDFFTGGKLGDSESNVRGRGQTEDHHVHDLASGYKNNEIRWGEVKTRTSKRMRVGDSVAADTCPAPTSGLYNTNLTSIASSDDTKSDEEAKIVISHSEIPTYRDENDTELHRNGELPQSPVFSGKGKEFTRGEEINFSQAGNDLQIKFPTCNGIKINERIDLSNEGLSNGHDEELENRHSIPKKIRIRSKVVIKELQNPYSGIKVNSINSEDEIMQVNQTELEQNLCSELHDEDPESNKGTDNDGWPNGSEKMKTTRQDADQIPSDSRSRMYNTVYTRSRSSKARVTSDDDIHCQDEGTSKVNNSNLDEDRDYPDSRNDAQRRTKSINRNVTMLEQNTASENSKTRENHDDAESSRRSSRFSHNTRDHLLYEWNSSPRVAVGQRSARNRRGSYNVCDLESMDKKTYPGKKQSWLMLLRHEECYRYIPQKGDEVAYLRQGHQEYIDWRRSHESGPWELFKGSLRAVEFCKVQNIDYSTLPGSGESCCKMSLEFIDPSSSAYSKSFKLTLPELIDFSDFLVERTRYDASIKRNWTHRDKCRVWWRNEDEEGGSWWEGRIISVKSKSSEFPDSPWERYVIQYKSDSSGQHLHSPWELHDPEGRWEHPHIDDEIRDKLLSSLARIEKITNQNQDSYGILKLKQVSQKSDFLNRFPVPLSLEVIKFRLENYYYRSLEAVEHDFMVMLSNAESYAAKKVDLASKVRRLSDWITRTMESILQ